MTSAALKNNDWSIAMKLDRLAGGLAYGLILIHFLALISLVFVLFTPAAKAEDLACGARDLVGQLKTSDPAAYAKLKAEGDKLKNSG